MISYLIKQMHVFQRVERRSGADLVSLLLQIDDQGVLVDDGKRENVFVFNDDSFLIIPKTQSFMIERHVSFQDFLTETAHYFFKDDSGIGKSDVHDIGVPDEILLIPVIFRNSFEFETLIFRFELQLLGVFNLKPAITAEEMIAFGIHFPKIFANRADIKALSRFSAKALPLYF